MSTDQTDLVLCFGVMGVDQIVQVADYPEPDGHTQILSDDVFIGGEAANTAVTLGTLGLPVRLMGNTLGEDRYGAFFREQIQRYPVDLQGIDVAPGVRTGHAVILSERDGGRSICGHFPDLRSRPLQAGDLEGVGLLSADPFLGKNAVSAARMAQKVGIPIFSIELSAKHPLATLCDVVINSAGFIRRHRLGSPADVAIGLLKAGVEMVGVTQGKAGCSIFRESGHSFDVPIYEVPTRDSTGAGDAFRAGLIYGYLKGWTLTRSAQFASGCAALSCCGMGGCGHVDGEQQVLDLISET